VKLIVHRGGVRLDKLISEATGCGRRRAAQWIREGRVRVDGRAALAATPAQAGQSVEISDPNPIAVTPVDAARPVRILLARGDLLAVDKPAGLHTQHGRSGGSVAEFLERCFPAIVQVGNRPEEAGTVHRLDRDTSGVLLAATSGEEYRRLRSLFSQGQVVKDYLALVAGRLGGAVVVERPLATRASRVVPASRHERGRAARTVATALETGDGWSLVHARMCTGVRHQIRAHLALSGHPLLGDGKYGGPVLPSAPRGGHLLHAMRVRIDGELDVTAPVPADFAETYAGLRTRRFRV